MQHCVCSVILEPYSAVRMFWHCRPLSTQTWNQRNFLAAMLGDCNIEAVTLLMHEYIAAAAAAPAAQQITIKRKRCQF